MDGSVKMGQLNGLATLSSSSMGKQNQVFQEVQNAGQEITMSDTQNIYSSARYDAGLYSSGKYSSGKYSSGHYNGTMRSSHAEGTLQKYAEYSSLDTWRTNELYLEKVKCISQLALSQPAKAC